MIEEVTMPNIQNRGRAKPHRTAHENGMCFESQKHTDCSNSCLDILIDFFL
jgi:hypothetical protein